MRPVARQRVLTHDTKEMIHKQIMDQLDFLIIKTFCSVKGTILRMKRQAIFCRKILGNHIFHKELCMARIHKELLKFNSKNTTQLKNGEKT